MADQNRPIRMDADLWDAFGAVAGPRSRSAILRQFVAWYTRTPGARMPVRPQPKDNATMRAHTTPPTAADDQCPHGKIPAECKDCNPILDPDSDA